MMLFDNFDRSENYKDKVEDEDEDDDENRFKKSI